MTEKITVIPHGLDNEAWEAAFDEVDAAAVRRDELGLADNEIAIMCVGELHERKGQQYLIDAFMQIAPQYPHAKLFLVGRGPQEQEYKRQAMALGDRIRFLGRRKDVPGLIKACDIFVLPSKREAFGLVILEASLAGKPIIASRVGGIKGIIKDGETGFLVMPENTEELKKTLSDLIENSSLRDRIGKQAHEYVRSTYTARHMADSTALIYDQII